MSSRSLNKVTLIGNLTRDPELRYTPTGAAVCTIGLATNRAWVTDSGEKKEETEFHRVVAWNKLAELCSQLLAKGRKVYVEGRLRTSAWTAQDGGQRTTTEIVIEDMIVLDSKRPGEDGAVAVEPQAPVAATPAPKTTKKATKDEPEEVKVSAPAENVNPDDIPF
jgi:single-strand DNA-binding protein